MNPSDRDHHPTEMRQQSTIHSTSPVPMAARADSIDVEKAISNSAESEKPAPQAVGLGQKKPEGPDGRDEVGEHDYHGNDQNELAIQRDLTHIPSHVSHHELHLSTTAETNSWQYTRFSPARKIVITTVVSICSFLAPMSSTAILSAIPEVAEEYGTTGTTVNISNALYMLFMGFSPCFYGPVSGVYGRRWICVTSAALYFAFSVGTALAPNLAAYFVFRMLTAFQGTAFLVVGTSVIGDIYPPTERATAIGWFFSGTLIGPAFGPFLGGIIVTYRTWRDIFWFQAALGGFALILVCLFLPETIPAKKSDDFVGLSGPQRLRRIWSYTNPFRIFALLFEYPNLVAAGLGSSSLVWNMYSLLTPIRYVLNPRFHLTSPIQSGLFYIAPGCGYLVGTFMGGRWADHTVKVWIRKRGRRVPEDRLRSCLPFLGVCIPGCMLVYGWSVEKAVGGIPLPVLAMFAQGIAQLFCFPSLNTYCLDVMQAKGRSAEVVASNYMLRYMFGAAGSAVVLPAVQKMGVGWFSTLSSLFMATCAGTVFLTTRYGERWRKRVDAKKEASKKKKQVKAEDRSNAEAEAEAESKS